MKPIQKNYLLIAAIIVFMLVSYYSIAESVFNGRENNYVSIKIGASKSVAGFSINSIIHNETDHAINFSRLGVFGNVIYKLSPDGKITTFDIDSSLQSDFKYTPDYSLNAGEKQVFQSSNSDEKTSFIYLLSRAIKDEVKVGRHEIWVDLINWVDFRGNKFDKYTSNRIVFYVGEDGKKIFINDPEAIRSFKEIGVEMGNSSEEVRVERSAEGNYVLVDIAHSNRFKNTVFSQFKNHSLIGWIALAMIASGIAYCFWRRISKRSANASMR